MDQVEASRILFQEGLTEEDQAWLREQFKLCGLPTPDMDLSWLAFEDVRASRSLTWRHPIYSYRGWS